MKLKQIILPLVAIFGVFFAIKVVKLGSAEVTPAEPIVSPSLSPFRNRVAGAGIIEPLSNNVLIGVPFAGIIEEVLVESGQTVAKGDPLFTLDRRELFAQLQMKIADVAVARAEEFERKAERDDAQMVYNRVISLTKAGASSTEEEDKARFSLARLEAGVKASAARLTVAESALKLVETELERSIVRSPIDGKVLQVNIRPGEYVQGGLQAEPFCILGNISRFIVRADIDENDAWRIKPGVRGEAIVRGNNSLKSALTFFRVEPYVIPKRSLTGLSSERTDTRVLQVLFTVADENFPVYVGQQVDVFIEVAE